MSLKFIPSKWFPCVGKYMGKLVYCSEDRRSWAWENSLGIFWKTKDGTPNNLIEILKCP